MSAVRPRTRRPLLSLLAWVSDVAATAIDCDVGTMVGQFAGRPSLWPKRARTQYCQHLTRRMLLPLIPMIVASFAIIVGWSFPRLYSWTVVPLWYALNMAIMMYTFCVLFPRANIRWLSADMFAFIGVGVVFVSLCEAIGSTYSAEIGWVAGNFAFAIAGLCGIPAFIYRRGRAGSTASATAGAIISGSVGTTDGMEPCVPGSVIKLDLTTSASTALLVTVCNVAFGLTVVVFGYLAQDHGQGEFYWRLLGLLVPSQLIMVAFSQTDTTYSFPYAVFYSVVVLRTPDFLGHLYLQVLNYVEDAARLWAPPWAFVARILLSVLYIVVMQGYFFIVSRVAARMSEENAFPRFLFWGQVYYYFVWYRMMTSDGPADWLFWTMLLVMNVNYILGSTGAYLDVIRGTLLCRPLDWASARRQSRETREFVYRLKIAEQDTLADICCLIVVPSIVTLQYLLGEIDAQLLLQNVWLRFVCMAGCRSLSARVSRLIFSRQWMFFDSRASRADSDASDIDASRGITRPGHARGRQMLSEADVNSATESEPFVDHPSSPSLAAAPFFSATMADLQHSFWYFAALIVLVSFACFQQPYIPTRFAFMRHASESGVWIYKPPITPPA